MCLVCGRNFEEVSVVGTVLVRRVEVGDEVREVGGLDRFRVLRILDFILGEVGGYERVLG